MIEHEQILKERKKLLDAMRKIFKLSRYKRDHDVLLYNFQDIGVIAEDVLRYIKKAKRQV